jgi:hypothetical protein
MPTRDYIPAGPNAFHSYQGNFVTLIDAHKDAWNIAAAAIAPLHTQQAIWDEVYPRAANPQNRTRADVLERRACQAAYAKAIRAFVNQQLAHNALVSDSDRERLGLHVRSASRRPAPDPTSAPVVARVDTSKSQQHTVHIIDASGSRTKPHGVFGCEVYMKKGEAPTSDAELVFAGLSTRSSFIVDFDIPDLGQIVHYRLRWVNTRGRRGPWSELVSAVVA